VFYKHVDCRYLLIVPKPKQMDIERKVSLIIATCKKYIMTHKKIVKQEGYLNCIDTGVQQLQKLHLDHLVPVDSKAKH